MKSITDRNFYCLWNYLLFLDTYVYRFDVHQNHDGLFVFFFLVISLLCYSFVLYVYWVIWFSSISCVILFYFVHSETMKQLNSLKLNPIELLNSKNSLKAHIYPCIDSKSLTYLSTKRNWILITKKNIHSQDRVFCCWLHSAYMWDVYSCIVLNSIDWTHNIIENPVLCMELTLYCWRWNWNSISKGKFIS